MLDFTELSLNGDDLELLTREILVRKGYRAYWSGKGPDAGRDLICLESRPSLFMPDIKRWLIQCKHTAHGGRSVSVNDLDDIVDSCTQHEADGYLLICSTVPSAAVVERLAAITRSTKNGISATYWDAVTLEQMLMTPTLWSIAQRFFPTTANAQEFRLYGTEHPNRWIAVFRGYYFYLSNRIGSQAEHHFGSVWGRIAEIERVQLAPKEMIRLRAIYYDDKNGNYKWYLDYMWPSKETPSTNVRALMRILGDGLVWNDGQFYSFDIKGREYSEYSDHYDPDHYDYYVPEMGTFVVGGSRPGNESWRFL